MKRILCIVCLIFLASCEQQPKNKIEYNRWFNDEANGYVRSRQLNDLIFKVQYRPVDLLVVNEIDMDKVYSEQDIDKIRESYGDSVYFMMELSIKDSNSENKKNVYEELKQQNKQKAFMEDLSFSILRHVSLKVNAKSYKPTLYHVEKSHELSNSLRFMFAFPLDNNENIDEMTFSYQNFPYSTDSLSFGFNLKDLTVPKPPIKAKAT